MVGARLGATPKLSCGLRHKKGEVNGGSQSWNGTKIFVQPKLQLRRTDGRAMLAPVVLLLVLWPTMQLSPIAKLKSLKAVAVVEKPAPFGKSIMKRKKLEILPVFTVRT